MKQGFEHHAQSFTILSGCGKSLIFKVSVAFTNYLAHQDQTLLGLVLDLPEEFWGQHKPVGGSYLDSASRSLNNT